MRPSHSDWLDDDDVESEDKSGDLDQEPEGAFADVPTEEAEEVPDFASSFASGGSPRPALQEAKDEDPTFQVQTEPPDEPGRSLLSTHPIILRDLPPQADTRPTQAQLSKLHRSLTQRDLVILQFLHDYRYLNTLQGSCTARLPQRAGMGWRPAHLVRGA
jgi:hypothetical protein